MQKHVLASDFLWQMTARMSRAKGCLEEQRRLTQILTLRMAGSESCCKNKEDIQKLRPSSSALSRLILRTQSPVFISAGRRVAQVRATESGAPILVGRLRCGQIGRASCRER